MLPALFKKTEKQDALNKGTVKFSVFLGATDYKERAVCTTFFENKIMQVNWNYYFAISVCVVSTMIYSANNLAAFGADYQPSNGNEVLLQVQQSQPAPEYDGALVEDKTMVLGNDQSARELIEMSTEYLAKASRLGDDRFVSYAEREIALWLSRNENNYIPLDVLVMQARVAQRQHDFARADSLLNKVLKKNPDHGDANLVFAYSLMAQGKADLADKSCRNAMKNVDHVLGLICQARTLLLQGRYAEATKRLSFLSQRTDLPNKHTIELKLTLAEMASWQGNSQLAERRLREVIALDEHNAVAKIQLADLLLNNTRYLDAKHFLAAAEHPALQLRQWVANTSPQSKHQADQSNIFSVEISRALNLVAKDNLEAATRDDVLLLLQAGYSQQALVAARKMWQSQREPDDALMYLRIAKQQSSKEDVRIIHRWMLATGLDDARLKHHLVDSRILSALGNKKDTGFATYAAQGELL